MPTRRDFLQIAAATAALLPAAHWSRAFAQQSLTQDGLLAMEPVGRLSILHVTDIHAQLVPIHFREPSVNLGVGEVKGLVPHVTGRALLDTYDIAPGSAMAHALTHEDFATLARAYGRMGGLDRVATVVNAIRAERGEANTLLLDGGDTWQNSWTSLQTRGEDMVECMALLAPDAMVGHWEFTLGEERVNELVSRLGFPFLAGNIRDTDWDEPVFDAMTMVERAGVQVAVIGQAFPYTPIANPRWMMPSWSFGIREEEVAANVEAARAQGADVVVLLSHNGFDVDRKLASRVPGIDVVLTAHTHDALPEPVVVGKTLVIASGSHGKFVSRLDLDVSGGEVRDFGYRLIPVFSDVIAPDPTMAAKIAEIRAPHEATLAEVLGRTEGLLYRRGNFNGTLDDVICEAMLEQRDAEIALSPGFRWGASILPGAEITMEDVTNATAMTYPATYRTTMTGARLKEVLEDVADNLFNPDPYYQQGGDMVRVGGVSYAIDVSAPMGSRISALTSLRTGEPLEAEREYTIAGWASVNEGTEGPPIWDVVAAHIRARGTIAPQETETVRVTGA
ncbi:thiosulfohydrolase SoxB [Salinarimonas ramus]|uniref:Thiosulfohydrolase SoxB n=1 Tax=Salinarimonas ramus TaxID=690164 RepID=A0A917V6T9_9HYPH|nr:thiosulfohydrolase SoxB [Salinarimonas ramus]GGK44512.1 thiosulfohydrolase SoxB [Salinarimonas ramus]